MWNPEEESRSLTPHLGLCSELCGFPGFPKDFWAVVKVSRQSWSGRLPGSASLGNDGTFKPKHFHPSPTERDKGGGIGERKRRGRGRERYIPRRYSTVSLS